MYSQLKKIYKEDQEDRLKPDVDFEFIQKRDEERRKKVKKIIDEGELKTGEDFYHAAMVFQHGHKNSHTEKAQELAKKSIELGCEKGKGLYAAATDRLLVRQGKKQKFGTQFFQKSPKDDWELRPIDPNTTDKERAKYNVPSLKEIKKKLEEMNK